MPAVLTAKKTTPKQAAMLKTPVGFAKGTLGHSIWGIQGEIMMDVLSERRIGVKSCHASGKTFTAADLAIWWVTTYSDGICVTTAPTWTQVEKLIWGEIRNTVGSPNCKIKYPAMNATELKISEKNYAIGISTNNAARIQGFHSGRVLIILDEAPGVRPEIWEAINGLRAGGDVRMLAIGNPVIVGGEFHDIFTSKRGLWKTRTISAFDTPNLRHCSLSYPGENGEIITHGSGHDLLTLSEENLDRNTRPYLCTRRWVKEMFEEWGPGHPYFQSRVLGDFPAESDDTLIPLSWLEKAKLQELEKTKDGYRAGLDVAGPGEAETVLFVMQGSNVVFQKAWPTPDPRGAIIAALAPYRDNLISFNVDSIGVGWGVYLAMSDEFDIKLTNGGTKKIVHSVNVGGKARDSKKFVNAKAEYYWNLRLMVKDGEMLGLTDEKTIGQLSVIKYRHNSKGQLEIESKSELTKRGVKSPDRAEAAMLCNAVVKRSLGGFEIPVDGIGNDTLVRQSNWRGAGSGMKTFEMDI